MEARPYPTRILEGAETGLVLFAAAFLGHNDAIHFAEAGMKATCVDVDESRLREMHALYPENWAFRLMDAWEYAETYPVREAYDVVSCDTWTGDLMRRSLDSLELWCSLARKAVTVTLTTGAPYTLPEGWVDTELYERAHGVYWLVLERR
jgi:hypothetical protein